jgi:hypothetical protein
MNRRTILSGEKWFAFDTLQAYLEIVESKIPRLTAGTVGFSIAT